MPKSQRLKSGPDASDSPDADPPTRAAPGSDTDAILAALKQTEQFVLTKIDSSVMAAAGELHKKTNKQITWREILNVRAEFYLKKRRRKTQHLRHALMISRRGLTAMLTAS